MALAALIPAVRLAEDEGDTLRATLPLAGLTLIEHQVRLAAHAGAGHIVILVERVPAALVAALDRLRRDGIAVEMARSLDDAVDRIHPNEALLVVADGCVADGATVARIAHAIAPAVLTVPDDAIHGAFERIDASARWGGLLLIDGGRLRATAAMLGDWDLESTLLRAAMQESALRLPAEPRGGAPAVLIAERAAMLDGAARALFSRSAAAGEDWPSRLFYPLVERLAAPALLARGIDPALFAAAAAGSAWLAALLILAGWKGAALIPLIAAGPLRAIARRLADARLATIRNAGLLDRTRDAGMGAALLALAADLMAGRGWGVWPVALLALLAMAAAIDARTLLVRRAGRVPAWRASPDALALVLLPFALSGWWLLGLWALAAYASASLLAILRACLARQD